MKSYEERLPLIDKAIDELGGDVRNCKSYIDDDVYIVMNIKSGKYHSYHFPSAIVMDDFDYVGTVDEFNQRKAELQNKPKEQDMNDWYEKGELPPVGTACEYIIGERRGYNECTFVGLNSRGSIVIEDCNGEYKSYHPPQIKFRPLRTETDKLVEQLERSFKSTGCVFTNDHRALAEHLVEAGYRKIKPMSEDEFVKSALKWFGSKRFEVSQLKLVCESLRKLHRAGCRFIETGE